MKRIKKSKNSLRQLRHDRVRKVIKGVTSVPRLSVFKGSRAMEVQIIDDSKGVTLCAAKTTEIKKTEKVEGRSAKVKDGYLLGKILAERAKAKGITKVVFDRGGYRYHGRVQAVAEGARDGGLQF
jgi:large subunit ribosomal protein L18